MRPAQRFLVAGLLVAAAEAGLGALLLGTVLAGYFFGCAAASVALAVGARRLFEPGDRPPEDPPGGGGPAPDPSPPWWPEFEAALRRYERQRERAPV